MVRQWVLRGFAALAALSAAGCGGASIGNGPGMAVFSGGPAPEAALAAPVSPGPAPAPVAMGSFLEGPVGSRLAEADRNAAFKAVAQALDSGNRQTWRGQRGVFGYVVPGAADPGLATAASGGAPGTDCRGFTETIYFAGRPETGHGTGCRDPDGAWRVVS